RSTHDGLPTFDHPCDKLTRFGHDLHSQRVVVADDSLMVEVSAGGNCSSIASENDHIHAVVLVYVIPDLRNFLVHQCIHRTPPQRGPQCDSQNTSIRRIKRKSLISFITL